MYIGNVIITLQVSQVYMYLIMIVITIIKDIQKQNADPPLV